MTIVERIAKIISTGRYRPDVLSREMAKCIYSEIIGPIERVRDEALRQLRIGMDTERKALAQCVAVEQRAEAAERRLPEVEKERDELREALKPFADEATAWKSDAPDDYNVGFVPHHITIGDFRRAYNLVGGSAQPATEIGALRKISAQPDVTVVLVSPH
jgi:hypothetical protein